jgi:putative ABC transport system permease protein
MQEYEPGGNLDSVNNLILIAFFIIIIAWVNYVNLSTSCSLNRAKEVGLRKVAGASRGQLVFQFFLETAILNLIAAMIAVQLVQLALPYFGEITGVPREFSIWSQESFWVALILMFSGGIFLSGFYPVMALSSFKPATVLKGKLGGKAGGINLRKILVVVQFSIGLFLIIATLTVYRQISFMRSQNLGFDMNQVLVVKAPRARDENYSSNFDSFRQELLKRSEILKISHVTEVPGKQIYWDNGGIFREGEDLSKGKNYQIVGIDYEFAGLFDLEFVAGRNFSRDFPADTGALILNETAVRFMGFEDAEDAIGKKVNYWQRLFPVIGVLKDYHQQSLKEQFEPHLFRFVPYGRGSMGRIVMKVETADMATLIKNVNKRYDEFFPGNPFDYFFLDEYYNQQYRSDELFGRVYGLFSVLAIFITALGVYGLSLFNITQQTKEIGIRKVLGASVQGIMRLLTKNVLVLIFIANTISWPAAYLIMNKWLDNFAFRTNMGISLFFTAGIMILLVVLFTVSYQVIRAARGNPVDAIKHE